MIAVETRVIQASDVSLSPESSRGVVMPRRARRIVAAATACGALLASLPVSAAAPAAVDQSRLDALLRESDPHVVAWRRDFHQNPELSNREVRTSKIVAAHLKKLGLTPETGIAHTGVAALLKGGRPGPTIALRADMDALPVTERTDVPFKSHATASYRGDTVGVMHACGHDAHTAILMGVAETLVALRDSLAGNVLFIFQPAEEGPPDGEEGGASMMLKEGLFDRYKPEAVFGLHVWAGLREGDIGVRPGPMMAASDAYRITVRGKQSHGSQPWRGIDPIVTSAQIINALQTVVSRRVDLVSNPAVVTVGAIKAGIRFNIIPESAEMVGTIRTFDDDQRTQLIADMKRIIEKTAEANGATARFVVDQGSGANPVTFNDPDLTARIVPTLQRVAGTGNVKSILPVTGAEDFSYFARKVPGVFFFVGSTPRNVDPATAPANHSDYFYLDEGSLPIGLRALTQVAVDYLGGRREPGTGVR